MFNEVKIRKELRNSNLIIWYRTKDVDYVANGYFALKLDLNKYRKILGVLAEKFGTIPKPYTSLRYDKSSTKDKEDTVIEIKKHEFVDMIDKRKTESIKFTELFFKHLCYDDELLGIFKGKDYIYVKKKYIDLVNRNCINLFYEGGKKYEPVFVEDNESLLMLMPMRIFIDNEYLKE